MGKPKRKVILPPDLPPESAYDDVDVSNEDLEFVSSNRGFAGFLKNMDTKSIDRHVSRVADAKEDELELLYEKRRKKASLQKPSEEMGMQVDRTDVLPVKTLDGELFYRTAKESKPIPTITHAKEVIADDLDHNVDRSVVRPTKAERRLKSKKTRKEAKKQAKLEAKVDIPEQTKQAEVLASVKEDLSAEEVFLKKKNKLAEIGISLLEDPEANIKLLKELIQFSNDDDPKVVKLALLSLLVVFKDIIPGYRIRLPTNKELEMKVSKAISKMRFYESSLLHSYKAYLIRLIGLAKQQLFHRVAVRCMCSLLEVVPHFNFRENLLASISEKISSSDDAIRNLCCSAIRTIFGDEAKHGGEATIEAVNLISTLVKNRYSQLHPDSIEVFLALKFDDEVRKRPVIKEKYKHKKRNWRRHEEPNILPTNEMKLSSKAIAAKTREEVKADFKAASSSMDPDEKRRIQTEILSGVFETYFRILKHTMDSGISRSIPSVVSSVGVKRHPLLAPCLKGLAKFSHLIDLDYMSDLLGCLNQLAGSGGYDNSSTNFNLSITERMQCCIVAFKVMANNLDALKVDLQDFFVQLYNLLLEYRPQRDNGDVLAEALKIMLCEGKQYDVQRTAAFVKRLASFSLCYGCAETMAALATLKHLLQNNIKCRNMLDNDAGGGSLSCLVVKYQPDAEDPNLSGALASVLWELSILTKHYNPNVSSMASSILSLNSAQNQVYLPAKSPQQAFSEFSIENEPSKITIHNKPLLNQKKRKFSGVAPSMLPEMDNLVDEDDLRCKIENHFSVLRSISDNKNLRRELNMTQASISLYKNYKKRNKKKCPKATEL